MLLVPPGLWFRVSVAALNLADVIETMAQLDCNIIRALANADLLVAHWHQEDRTFAQLRRALEDALVAARGLRTQALRIAIDRSAHAANGTTICAPADHVSRLSGPSWRESLPVADAQDRNSQRMEEDADE